MAALLLAAERVVIADTFAFSRQAAHNRARIRTATGGQWLTVPRRHGAEVTPLNHLGLVADGWARRHLHALRTAYGMAPFSEHYLPEIARLFAARHDSVGTLAVAATRWTARHLGVEAPVEIASELAGAPSTLPAVWAAAGGGDLLALPESADRDRARLAPLGVRVHTLVLDTEARYRQAFPGFVGGMSSLDLLMNHGPASADWLRDASRVE